MSFKWTYNIHIGPMNGAPQQFTTLQIQYSSSIPRYESPYSLSLEFAMYDFVVLGLYCR